MPEPIRPVINVSRLRRGRPPAKLCRVIFPPNPSQQDVAAVAALWRSVDGLAVDVRQIGPDGFALPLNVASLRASADLRDALATTNDPSFNPVAA